jgi:hypothetical protein
VDCLARSLTEHDLVYPGRPVIRLDVVMRTWMYEYVPRTAANLAFADIHAQHPHATRP